AGGATRRPETAAGAPEGTDPVASRERADPVAPGEGDPEPDPVASGERRPEAEPVASGERRPEAEPVASAEGRPEPVPEPEAAARPGAAGPGTVTLPGTGAVTVPEDTAVPEIELAEGGGSAGARPRRRTRTVVLAGIAVAAVFAGVALAVGLPGGGTDDSGRRGPVGAATSGGGPGQQDVTSSPTPSASPSASASAGRKNKDDDTHKDGAEAGRGASASASASPSAAPADAGDRGGVPLTVRAEPYAWESACSQRYLIDRPPSRVSPPPSEQDAPAWVGAAGAVSSGEQFVQLTVQGTGEETVVVEGITVRVAGKRPPLAWNDFAMGYPGVGCGGDVPARSFTVALDAARPAVVPRSGHRDFPFKVSQSDPEVYYISADASAYDVRWYLELKWSSGTLSGTLTVDDRGRPFRVSGNNGRPAYEFPLGGDAWVPEGTTTFD
ncbi:hypothetical protein ACPF8X_32100, partial [Streptomyces sp. G35A]